MAMKVLKDSGNAPVEVLLLRELAEMRATLESLDPESPETAALRQKISQREVEIALRIERLSKPGR